MTAAAHGGPVVGVLGLQGAVRPHRRVLEGLGAAVRDVRLPDHLDGLDALVLPGGESTTIGMLLNSSGLREPLGAAIDGGLPVLATCAGVIVLAQEVIDGRPDQVPLGRLGVAVRRNAYGRQVESFEADVSVEGWSQPFPAVFIRAPVIEQAGDEVEIMAEREGAPVLVRQGAMLAATFHPELSGDPRIHELFLGGI